MATIQNGLFFADVSNFFLVGENRVVPLLKLPKLHNNILRFRLKYLLDSMLTMLYFCHFIGLRM